MGHALTDEAPVKTKTPAFFTAIPGFGIPRPLLKRSVQMAEKVFVDLSPQKTTGLQMLLVGMVLSLLGLCLISVLFIHEYSLRRQMALSLQETEQSRKQLEHTVTELNSQIKENKNEMERLAQDLGKAEEKAALVDEIRRQHEIEIQRLKELYEGQIADIRGVLETRNDVVDKLESHLKKLQAVMESQQGALGPASAGMEHNPTEVKNESPEALAGAPGKASPKYAVWGKVALVDPENRFVIVTLGSSHGARLGSFVQLFKDDQQIGQARIDRLYPHLSAATVLSNDALMRVQKGDSVYLAL